MQKVLGNILCGLNPNIKVKQCIFLQMQFLLNCWTYQLQTLQVHRSYDVEVLGNIQIIYFLVNASPPKLLHVETSKSAGT